MTLVVVSTVVVILALFAIGLVAGRRVDDRADRGGRP